MVLAGRRMVERHWMVGPVWWVCGRILTSVDPSREAWSLIDAFESDQTQRHMHDLLDEAIASDSDHAPVVVGATAGGPSGFVVQVPHGTLRTLEKARRSHRQVWIVTGVGRILPEAIWGGVAARFDQATDTSLDGHADGHELVPLAIVDLVIGPEGPLSGPEAVRRSDVVVAPELLRH